MVDKIRSFEIAGRDKCGYEDESWYLWFQGLQKLSFRQIAHVDQSTRLDHPSSSQLLVTTGIANVI